MSLRTVFRGTPEAAVPTLEAVLDSDHRVVAVATAPDRPRGGGMELAPAPVKQRALAAGIPVLQPPTLRTPEAQAELAAAGADVFVVCAYGLILPPAVLEEPRLRCVNVHFSLLPAFRGAAPLAGAILAGGGAFGRAHRTSDPLLDTSASAHTLAVPNPPDHHTW